MSTLHTVNKSPFERTALASALRHVKPGDALILIEDAVVGARKAGASVAAIEGAAKDVEIYVLAPDLAARGIDKTEIVPCARIVDYGGFVDLVVKHARTQAWL